MTYQPMEEGWLTTYEEITDRRAGGSQDGRIWRIMTR